LQRNDSKTLSNEELASLCTTSAIKTASGTLGYCSSIAVILVLLLGPLVFGNAVVPGAALLAGTLLFVCYAVSRWKRGIAKSWTAGVARHSSHNTARKPRQFSTSTPPIGFCYSA
jgi:hypothetical protein